jgi:hypothetical protein
VIDQLLRPYPQFGDVIPLFYQGVSGKELRRRIERAPVRVAAEQAPILTEHLVSAHHHAGRRGAAGPAE